MIFVSVLMHDEKVKKYEWLFKGFLILMGCIVATNNSNKLVSMFFYNI